jgi:hypothetical protein
MRPSLAFGPIDSIAQYLLYVSVVVLGVALPLLIQKWRKKREDAGLVVRTAVALKEELAGNKARLLESKATIEAFLADLDGCYEKYALIWHSIHNTGQAGRAHEQPMLPDRPLNVAATSQVAWDVARYSNALPLLSTGQLRAVTKAYSLQAAFEATRNTLLESAFKAELLDTPVRLDDAPSIERRLELLATARSIARAQIGLLSSATSAYDIAIATLGDGQPGA